MPTAPLGLAAAEHGSHPRASSPGSVTAGIFRYPSEHLDGKHKWRHQGSHDEPASKWLDWWWDGEADVPYEARQSSEPSPRRETAVEERKEDVGGHGVGGGSKRDSTGTPACSQRASHVNGQDGEGSSSARQAIEVANASANPAPNGSTERSIDGSVNGGTASQTFKPADDEQQQDAQRRCQGTELVDPPHSGAVKEHANAKQSHMVASKQSHEPSTKGGEREEVREPCDEGEVKEEERKQMREDVRGSSDEGKVKEEKPGEELAADLEPHNNVAVEDTGAATDGMQLDTGGGLDHLVDEPSQDIGKVAGGTGDNEAVEDGKVAGDTGSKEDDDDGSDDEELHPKPVVHIANLAEAGKSYVSRHSSRDESMPMDGNCAFWGILRHLKRELTDANLLQLRGEYLDVCRSPKLRKYFPGYDDGVWAALIDRLTLPAGWKSKPGSVLHPDKWFSTLLAPIVAFCAKRPFAQLDKVRGPRGSFTVLPVNMVEGAEVTMLLYNGTNHYDACWPEGPLPPVRVDWLGTKAAALVVETWQHEKQHEAFEFETRERAGEGHGFEVCCHCLSRAGWTDPEPWDMQQWEREQGRRQEREREHIASGSSSNVEVKAEEAGSEAANGTRVKREGGTSNTTRFAPRSGSKEVSKPSQGDLQASTQAAMAAVKQEPGTTKQQALYGPPPAPRAVRARKKAAAAAAANKVDGQGASQPSRWTSSSLPTSLIVVVQQLIPRRKPL